MDNRHVNLTFLPKKADKEIKKKLTVDISPGGVVNCPSCLRDSRKKLEH
ncbi:MAG: hypothetical protein QM227_04040 [Bacillota bacterium]|jgi:hypothetical protein|nr:hypothetical protein [Bacillota bacterium]